MTELLSCPFCGYKYAGEIKNGETLIGFTHIACADTVCQAQVIGGTKEEAIKRWNTRTLPLEVEAVIEAAKKWCASTTKIETEDMYLEVILWNAIRNLKEATREE